MSSAITRRMLGLRDCGAAAAPTGAMSAGRAVLLPAGSATGERPEGPPDPPTTTRVASSTTARNADDSAATRSRALPVRGGRGIGSFPRERMCRARGTSPSRIRGCRVVVRAIAKTGAAGIGQARLGGPVLGVLGGRLLRLLVQLLAGPAVQPVTEHGAVAVVGLVLKTSGQQALAR